MAHIIRTWTVDGMARFALIGPTGIQCLERFFTATAAAIYAADRGWIVSQ